MNQPSSTITAATLAGFAVAFIWEMIDTFTDVEPSLGSVGASIALASGLVGYFKKENVLPVGNGS